MGIRYARQDRCSVSHVGRGRGTGLSAIRASKHGGKSAPELDEVLLDRSAHSTANRRPSRPKVSVVIPALNEAENLPFVLPALADDLHEVLLVDGASEDGTVDVARELYPRIRIVVQTGRGKGEALRAGFATATGDIVVMLDADGSADPREIPAFVGALRGGADYAKGSRFFSRRRKCGHNAPPQAGERSIRLPRPITFWRPLL